MPFFYPMPSFALCAMGILLLSDFKFFRKNNYAAVASYPEEDAHRRGDTFSATSTVIVP